MTITFKISAASKTSLAKKEKHHLKLTAKGIIILVVFVIALLVGTYFFTGYMLTNSHACVGGNCSTGPGYVDKEGHCVGAGAVCADKEKPGRTKGINKAPARRNPIPTPTSRP